MKKTFDPMRGVILAIAVLGLSSGAACAQDGPPPGGPGGPGGGPDGPGAHQHFDPFGDATVSRAEAQAKAEAEFAKLDVDHDGYLTADEFSAEFPADSRMRMMAPMMMLRIDADGDGKLSKAEFVGMTMKRFDDADANHDGMLTKAERDAAREAMRGRNRNGGGGHGHNHGGGGDDGPPPGPPPGDGGPPPGPPPGGDDGQ